MRLSTVVLTALFCLYLVNGASAKNFKDNGNGTVTDSDTGLVWQQGEVGLMNWEMALAYCEGLSLVWEDWRLPVHKELNSLADYSKASPALDRAYFPNVFSSAYWSATTSVSITSHGWYLNFGSGYLDVNSKLNNFHVRCVRGGE